MESFLRSSWVTPILSAAPDSSDRSRFHLHNRLEVRPRRFGTTEMAFQLQELASARAFGKSPERGQAKIPQG